MLVTPVTNIIQVFGDLIITNSVQVRNDLTFLDLTVQQIEYLNKKYSLFKHWKKDKNCKTTNVILGRYGHYQVFK